LFRAVRLSEPACPGRPRCRAMRSSWLTGVGATGRRFIGQRAACLPCQTDLLRRPSSTMGRARDVRSESPQTIPNRTRRIVLSTPLPINGADLSRANESARLARLRGDCLAQHDDLEGRPVAHHCRFELAAGTGRGSDKPLLSPSRHGSHRRSRSLGGRDVDLMTQ